MFPYLLLIIGLTIVYRYLLRPLLMTLGASAAEIDMTLPGDELLPRTQRTSTRAITIHAAPESVWPWLVQIGHQRAGFYSFALLEHMIGRATHNAHTLNYDWQEMQVGDLIPMGPDGSPQYRVLKLLPAQALVLRAADPITGKCFDSVYEGRYTDLTWTLYLYPHAHGTRLVMRRRVVHDSGTFSRILWNLLDVISAVMEWGMLRGIRTRAERGWERAIA